MFLVRVPRIPAFRAKISFDSRYQQVSFDAIKKLFSKSVHQNAYRNTHSTIFSTQVLVSISILKQRI